MRLSSLDPKLSDNKVLRFDCPKCSQPGINNCHAVRVPLEGSHWTYSGEFPETLTVMPSIDIGCWHGFISNGDVSLI